MTPASRQASQSPWGTPASRQASQSPWGTPASRQASQSPWGTRALLLLLLLLVLVVGCARERLMTRYLAQAGYGQAELLSKARPIDEVIRDPNTPVRTAMLLGSIDEIKAYGRTFGLSIRRNYRHYAALGRPAAVWFVGAADPLQFKPRKWCFPIVGCFAGLGWFDEGEAVKHKLDLEAQGYDAIVRPASAYSTGGWFPDPVLSTMLGGGDDALPELFNVIIHESVHATVLVPDQPFFNESFATYVADTLTDHWIAEKFGAGSPEDLAWTLGQAVHLARTSRLLDGYNQLKKLYESKLGREEKLKQKAQIIDALVDDLRIRRPPTMPPSPRPASITAASRTSSRRTGSAATCASSCSPAARSAGRTFPRRSRTTSHRSASCSVSVASPYRSDSKTGARAARLAGFT